MAEITIQEQLNDIVNSKADIKSAINEYGGEVTDETTFREYPKQIQTVIDKHIVPYSDLKNTMELALRINGEEV